MWHMQTHLTYFHRSHLYFPDTLFTSISSSWTSNETLHHIRCLSNPISFFPFFCVNSTTNLLHLLTLPLPMFTSFRYENESDAFWHFQAPSCFPQVPMADPRKGEKVHSYCRKSSCKLGILFSCIFLIIIFFSKIR